MHYKTLFPWIILFLLATVSAAQTPAPIKPLEQVKVDTSYGLALITDSVIVMRPTADVGEYQFASVLGGIFVQAMRITETKSQVRASDGQAIPYSQRDEWYYVGQPGRISETRIVVFKQYRR